MPDPEEPHRMLSPQRLEAFSDGVLAIVITITVLGIHVPDETTASALRNVLPALAIYAWSFQTVGTYWNNHHHLIRATKHVTPTIMWQNLHLLFWLSLIPFTTGWLGYHLGTCWPTAAYCAILLLAAFAYTLLERAVVANQGRDSALARALGNDTKGKISLLGYVISVGFAFVLPWISYAIVVAVSLMWFVPDRRVVGKPAGT